MRSADIATLFDFNYWANRSLLTATADLDPSQWATAGADRTLTYRGLRATLVHILDVESSWRHRLKGRGADVWDVSLSEGDFSSSAMLAERWHEDEREMRVWLATLSDTDLSKTVDLGDGDRFQLWYYLVHMVTHSDQQRRDVQLLLRLQDIEPPDLEFLYYADYLAATSDS